MPTPYTIYYTVPILYGIYYLAAGIEGSWKWQLGAESVACEVLQKLLRNVYQSNSRKQHLIEHNLRQIWEKMRK